MFKQVYLYDGTAILLEAITKYTNEGEPIETFNYPKEYTEIQPQDGLYLPIHFDGTEWIGSKKEDFEYVNPPLLDEESMPIAEIQSIVEDLLLQMLDLQMNNVSKEA